MEGFSDMEVNHIERWIVCVSGFCQDESKPSGMMRLWRDVHHEVHRNSTNANSVVIPKTWRVDADALAEWMWRTRPVGHPPVIDIVGYSWGGAAAVRLCNALGRRGQKVRNLILCDAVYRHPYWLGNWRAFMPGIPLVVPGTVQNLWTFKQDTNWPRGHRVICARPTVFHGNTMIRDVTHQYIDDSFDFQMKARKILLGEI